MKYELGKLESDVLEIVKHNKKIKLVDVGRLLGLKKSQMENVHRASISLWDKGVIEVVGKNPKIAVFVKDFVPPERPIKPPRKIIKIEELNIMIDLMIDKEIDKSPNPYNTGYYDALVHLKKELLK